MTNDEPRTATELIGHEGAEQTFLDTWNSGRLAHAWLITGPRGIGKATLAFRIARFALAGGGDQAGGLFGGAPESLAVEETHPVFRRVASGGHADFKLVERGWSDENKTKRKTEIAVDDVRAIGSFLSMTPAEGKWRVVIVDAVDEMNRSSANAILKSLEEPPKNTLLLLVAHSPGRVLLTIRSRCRRLALKPLMEEQLIGLLARLRPELKPDDGRIIARLAEGSAGRALSLTDEGGLELYRSLLSLLFSLPRLDHLALHQFGDRMAKDEASFNAAGDLLLWWLSRAASLTAGKVSDALEVIGGEFAQQRRLVEAAGLDRWVEVWEKITHLFERADAVNLDRKQVVLNAFFALERLGRS